MANCSKNRGSRTSWGPTIIFSEKNPERSNYCAPRHIQSWFSFVMRFASYLMMIFFWAAGLPLPWLAGGLWYYFQCRLWLLDAIASPSSYPCQSVSLRIWGDNWHLCWHFCHSQSWPGGGGSHQDRCHRPSLLFSSISQGSCQKRIGSFPLCIQWLLEHR